MNSFDRMLFLCFQDSFIEDIESILNSGTVVDLFEPDEFDALTMDLKNDAYSVGMSDTPNLLREFFYQVTFDFIFSRKTKQNVLLF